jgi:glucuronate isomerase
VASLQVSHPTDERIVRRGTYRPLVLHADRFFDSDPEIRRSARALYEETRDLPLICPHGHVDPAILANDTPFPEPASLIVVPDHYIVRMLYSRGAPMESLGIPARDGAPVESDPRRIWQIFADNVHLFHGTPTGAWLDHELHEVFGVKVRLDGDSAQHVYDQIAERLASPEFRPRRLFERFNIEVLATTDAASDSLEHHRALRESGWRGRVIPTFRPDAVFRIAAPEWASELECLGQVSGEAIADYASFIDVLGARRAVFKSLGGTATDHAVVEPFACRIRTHRRSSCARFEERRRHRISGVSRRTCSWRWRACPSRTDWSCSFIRARFAITTVKCSIDSAPTAAPTFPSRPSTRATSPSS